MVSTPELCYKTVSLLLVRKFALSTMELCSSVSGHLGVKDTTVDNTLFHHTIQIRNTLWL